MQSDPEAVKFAQKLVESSIFSMILDFYKVSRVPPAKLEKEI